MPNTDAALALIRPVAAAAETPEPVRQWLNGLVELLTDDPKFEKGQPVPNSIGAAADLYAEVRQRRLSMEKAAEAVKSRETEIHDMILSALNESTDTGASGKFYRVQRVEKDRLHVKDWAAFHAFVRQNDAFEMLQRRLSDKAVQEWIDNQQPVLRQNPDGSMVQAPATPPGVEQAKVPTLSFTKV